jgi:hypothetical protein
MNFNPEMVKGVLERMVLIAITYAVAKGLIPEDLKGPFTEVASMIIVVVVFGALGIKQNTQASLTTATFAVTGAKEIVVTNKADAKALDEATPANVKVVTK